MAALVAVACRSPFGGRDVDSRACRQTYEFGNYGCARVLALVEGPPAPWPASYRVDVRATPRSTTGGVETVGAARPGVGPVPLELTRFFRLPTADDTLSVWVVARLLEDPRPVVVGVPLPVFAADSVLRLIRFTPVGSVPSVDTVHLTLRRP